MWDVEQYRRIIQKIAKHGSLNGKCVKNKGDIYVQLSRKLYVSVDTVKSWARKNSNGPSDEAVVKQLEAIFNTCLTKNNVEEIKEEDNMTTYSDFVKSNIKEAYKLVMDFIKSDDIESEERYCEMRSNLETLKVAIPKEIYVKLINFVDEKLDPIIYDNDNYFAELHTEEFGYLDEENCFHLKDEQATYKFLGLFMSMVCKLINEFEDFGMKELYPVLIK